MVFKGSDSQVLSDMFFLNAETVLARSRSFPREVQMLRGVSYGLGRCLVALRTRVWEEKTLLEAGGEYKRGWCFPWSFSLASILFSLLR